MAANAGSGQEGSVGHAFWRIGSYLFSNLRGKSLGVGWFIQSPPQIMLMKRQYNHFDICFLTGEAGGSQTQGLGSHGVEY